MVYIIHLVVYSDDNGDENMELVELLICSLPSNCSREAMSSSETFDDDDDDDGDVARACVGTWVRGCEEMRQLDSQSCWEGVKKSVPRYGQWTRANPATGVEHVRRGEWFSRLNDEGNGDMRGGSNAGCRQTYHARYSK
jgi:hypothetical protein